MNLKRIADELALTCLTPEVSIDETKLVRTGYASDLLSDVIAHAPRGGVLVTVQVHMNVVAVAAAYAELAAVIFVLGRRPDEEVRLKAIEEGVPLYTTDKPAFDVVGRLYGLGIRGTAG